MKRILYLLIAVAALLFTVKPVQALSDHTQSSCRWVINNNNTIEIQWNNTIFYYPVTFNQTGDNLSGSLQENYYNPNFLGTLTGKIEGNNVTLSVDYPAGSIQGTRTFTGTISSTGSINGTWVETGNENAQGSWSTSLVFASKICPQGQNLNAAQCNQQSAPVVNITYKVLNDPDSGFYGDWATDNYNKKIQVWDQGDGNYCAIVKYSGQFNTLENSLSPQSGVALGAGISGTFEGGYRATFNGKFNQNSLKAKGSLPTVDYSSSKIFDWIGTYFQLNSNFNMTYWSWTYNAGNNGTWINASNGSVGDITK
ncbi:MAG TPA: hypothetical protein VF828_02155 [Patescibacteria group bacterium]